MNEVNLKKIIRVCLYVVPFVPLIFIEGFFFPFIITKTLLFRLVIQIGLTAYIFLLIKDFNTYKPQWSWGMILVALSVCVAILSAVFGFDTYRSFFSTFERMEGVMLYIYLFIYVVLLQTTFTTKKEWKNLLYTHVGVSFLVSVYGIVQKFALLPVFEAGTNRVASTIGNAAFLAGYLILALGITVYLYQKESTKKYQYALLITAILHIATIMLTATRGAILGLLIGSVVYAVLQGVQRKGKMRMFAIGAVVLMVCGSTLFYVYRDTLARSSIEVIRRVATISPAEGTVKTRLLIWQWAWEGIQDDFVLGVGHENFPTVYNKYYTPESEEDWFDRTHNVYLDQIVHTGIIGFVVYVAIWLYLFAMVYRKRKDDPVAFYVFAPMFIAYGIHNAFVFDTINTLLLFFLFIVFVSTTHHQTESKKVVIPEYLRWGIYAVLGVLNMFVFVQCIAKPYSLNRNIYVGHHYIVADTEKARKAFSKTSNSRFALPESASQMHQASPILLGWEGIDGGTKAKYLGQERQLLNAAIAIDPRDVRNRLFYGEYILSNYKDAGDLLEAEEALLQARAHSPKRSELSYLLFNVYLNRGQISEAKAVMEELITSLPWFGEPKIFLANTIRTEEPDRAEQLFQEGVHQFVRVNPGTQNAIIEYILSTRDTYDEALSLFVELHPSKVEQVEFYKLLIDIARQHIDVGEYTKAQEALDLVQMQSPAEITEDVQIQSIIFSLQEKINQSE